MDIAGCQERTMALEGSDRCVARLNSAGNGCTFIALPLPKPVSETVVGFSPTKEIGDRLALLSD